MSEIKSPFQNLTEELNNIDKQKIMWNSTECVQVMRFVEEMNEIA
jgi:hypothetical protein